MNAFPYAGASMVGAAGGPLSGYDSLFAVRRGPDVLLCLFPMMSSVTHGLSSVSWRSPFGDSKPTIGQRIMRAPHGA